MDYFSVIVLVIVTFIFISDRNIKSIERIKEEKKILDIEQEIENIKEKLQVIKLSSKDMNYINILEKIKSCKKEYVLLQNNELEVDDNKITVFIANYIDVNKKACGFNLIYVDKEKKWSLKKIYLDIINYLNIFNKKDLSTYGVIICRVQDLNKSENKFKKELVSYAADNITYIEFDKEKVKTKKLKRVYLRKIQEANFDIIIKIFLLIISGSIITTNLIYYIFNVNNNINNLVIALVIYYCYSYIIRYIYRPIGPRRIVATYIFPVYFIAYIVVSIYAYMTRVIKKVHAS